MAGIIVTDHSDEVLAELERKVQAALNACGQQAASHASQNVTAAGRIDTGALRNSINYKINGDICYVGTNTKYAIYNEYGTGIYVGGGRTSPWSYKDAKGNWHRTRGMSGIHFLKNAMADNIDEYKSIIEEYLNG